MMSNTRISTEVQTDRVDSPISVKFKSYFHRTIDLIYLLRQGRLDQSATVQALKTIENNAKLQSILFDELINQRLLSLNKLNTEVASELLNVDDINQQFEQFQYPPSVEFKFSINCILCSTHLLRQGRLNQSATVQALKIIEDNAKLQSILFDELINWRLTPHELYLNAGFFSQSSNCNEL